MLSMLSRLLRLLEEEEEDVEEDPEELVDSVDPAIFLEVSKFFEVDDSNGDIAKGAPVKGLPKSQTGRIHAVT